MYIIGELVSITSARWMTGCRPRTEQNARKPDPCGATALGVTR
jgi:hypothetical protein